MTSSSRWWGPELDTDASALRAMLDSFVATRGPTLDDDPSSVSQLVTELAELGLWTIGTAEASGGGGADQGLTVLALERLGRSWPALGWAAAQAHAAVDILANDNRFTDLIRRLHSGHAAVAVVDASATHVRLVRTEEGLAGTVDRVDTAATEPHILVLDDDDTAVLVAPSAVTFTPLRRTGLGGAFTRTAHVDATGGALDMLTGIDVTAARIRLRRHAAAVAAGIAGAAADAAVDYAQERRQFGNTLSVIPTVRQSLLEQTTRAAISLSAALTAETPMQAAAAAQEACDSAIQVAAASLQTHGGYGYLAEYGAERRLRDAISLRAAVDTAGVAVEMARALVSLDPPPTALRTNAS